MITARTVSFSPPEYNRVRDPMRYSAKNDNSRAYMRADVRGQYISLRQFGKESGSCALLPATGRDDGRLRRGRGYDKGRGRNSGRAIKIKKNVFRGYPTRCRNVGETEMVQLRRKWAHQHICIVQTTSANGCCHLDHVADDCLRPATAALAVQDVRLKRSSWRGKTTSESASICR